MGRLALSDTSRSDTVIELSGVWKTYRQAQRSERLGDVFRNLLRSRVRDVAALRGIDLRVRRGEIVAYAGPNGAGKSTTIKILSSLLAPDAGHVRVLGMNPVRERVRYVRRIGVVFGQRTELWWDHPVAASFEWKRVVWDVPRDRYERMLGFVREVLGLDEFVKHLNRERQITVLVTSHDMADLEELAGRIVMLHHGDIAFDGDFDQLRRRFADRRRLLIETSSATPPTLRGAQLIQSEGCRHEYAFDASRVKISDLLDQAAAQTEIQDVETHAVIPLGACKIDDV